MRPGAMLLEEFLTIMWFDSWEAVKRFAGDDHEKAYVPSRARDLPARYGDRSQHYEVREQLVYDFGDSPTNPPGFAGKGQK